MVVPASLDDLNPVAIGVLRKGEALHGAIHGLFLEGGAELLERTGQSSLPHVFIAGEHVGGCFTGTEAAGPGLAALRESGELEERLRGAGA